MLAGRLHRHRVRVLGALTLSGMLGLAIFLVPLASNPPGRVPYSLLLTATTVACALLTYAILTADMRPLRTGAGLAGILWCTQIAMIGYGLVVDLQLFASPWTAVAGILIDVLPLASAVWLYWLAGQELAGDSVDP